MKKKHFMILGRVGLIYYSWLLVVLFLCLIFAYESTKAINWPAIITGILFFLLVLYTYFNSYWQNNCLKLPFKRKINKNRQPQLISRFNWLAIYQVKVTELEKYLLLRIEKQN